MFTKPNLLDTMMRNQMVLKNTPGVNFNILNAKLLREKILKSQKDARLGCLFSAFGIFACKSGMP